MWIAQVTLEFLKRYPAFVSLGESLLQCLEEGQAFVRRFRDELVECRNPSRELLDFFDGLWRCHIKYGLHLLWVASIPL